MNTEQIKKEAARAMQLIGLVSVNGDAVDVVAAVRQSLRNIITVCEATAPETESGETE